MKRKRNKKYVAQRDRYWSRVESYDKYDGQYIDHSRGFSKLDDAKKHQKIADELRRDPYVSVINKLYKNNYLLNKKYKVKNKKSESNKSINDFFARLWIICKLGDDETLTQEKLLNTVGAFSNKKKEFVMREKNLSSKEYDERYKFLSRVYYLLSSEKF